MADGGAVLKFPGGKPSKKQEEAFEPTPPPAMDSYSHEDTVDLYQIASSVKRKAEDLIKFVDDNRAVARSAGIEILGVQVGSILEGDRFERVMDALEDAVFRRVGVTLTRDGVDKIHRLEKLTADADQVIIGFMNGKKIEPQLGQATAPSYPAVFQVPAAQNTGSDVSKWMPVIVIGIAGIVGIIAILALTQRTKNA